METMLMHVEAGYASHGNPYHNHMHACDVLQTVHYFISQTGLSVSYVLSRRATTLGCVNCSDPLGWAHETYNVYVHA